MPLNDSIMSDDNEVASDVPPQYCVFQFSLDP